MSKDIKIVFHLADIHLRTYRMHKEYGEIFKKTLIKIKELSKGYDREEVRIVIAGDKNLEKIAPIVLIAGNHDLLENNKDRLDSLTPMVQLLNELDIRYYKNTECILDNNIVWCVYSVFDDNSRPNIEEARENYGEDKKYYGLFHAPINGASTDIGYIFDNSETLTHFKGCDAVLCGDIHKRQTLNYKNDDKMTPVVYSGSLIQQNFGESIENHGFLLWDVKSNEFQEFNIDSEYGFYQFKISSIDDIENNSEILTNG
jgi:DNA repair exonuclease SbcCD nuclease subunit